MNDKKRTRKPTTVGEMLAKEFLIPLGISCKVFAEHIEEDVDTITGLIENKFPLSPDLALKIASSLGTSPDFWMKLQHTNDYHDLNNFKKHAGQ